MKRIKLTEVPADSKLKAGTWINIDKNAELDALTASGHKFVDEAEVALITAREAAVDIAIKASKAFAPKEDTTSHRQIALDLEMNKAGLGVQYIANLPARESGSQLTARLTQSDAGNTVQARGVEVGEIGMRETVRAFLQESEDDYKLLRNGGVIRATHSLPNREKELQLVQAKANSKSMLAASLSNMIERGGNFRLTEDFVKAAYDGYADPAGALGVLNTALTLQWTFGHLENQLIMIDDITTDVTGTPILFQQWTRSRYIKVPGVMLKTATTSWATNASAGNDVDVMVQMNNFAGCSIGINNAILGATARQLFNEQKQPQLYGLAEYIIYTLINTAINGSLRFDNTGVNQSTVTAASAFVDPTFGKGYFNVAGATLSTFVSSLRAAMNLSKFPGGDEAPGTKDLMRFVWANTILESSISADTNYQLNSSIQGIKQNTEENLIQTGMFTRIGNNKFRASQLVLDNNTLSGTGADSGTNQATVVPGSTATAKVVGIGGTRSGLMFVSRLPVDYTKVMPDIPQTAAIEVYTTPKLGIPFLIVKYLDHGYETAYMRAETMWGSGIGDERQLMLLRQQ